jgi:hypothetical protein
MMAFLKVTKGEALKIAMSEGFEDVMLSLVRGGVTVTSEMMLLAIKREWLQSVIALKKKITSDQYRIASFLLAAIEVDNPEVVLALIEGDLRLWRLVGAVAVRNNRPRIVTHIAQKVDRRWLSEQLWPAVICGHADTLKVVLANADKLGVKLDKDLALLLALEQGDAACAKCLVLKGARVDLAQIGEARENEADGGAGFDVASGR